MNNQRKSLVHIGFDSPLGWIVLAATQQGIRLLHFCGAGRLSAAATREFVQTTCPDCVLLPEQDWPLLVTAQRAVERYFAEQAPPPAVPLDMQQGTRFQQQVWQALREIPFGRTRSYGEIAAAIGNPRATRAVGQACGRNPVPLLVPCHRVLAAGGKPGGFGGGLHIKRALLEVEGVTLSL